MALVKKRCRSSIGTLWHYLGPLIHCHREAGFGVACGADDDQFGLPIPNDLRLHGHAILAGGRGAQDFGKAVQDGGRPGQSEFKTDISDVHQPPAGVTELNEDIVGGRPQMVLRREKIGRQIGNRRRGKGPP